MNKNTIWIVIIVVVLGFGAWLYMSATPTPSINTPAATAPTSSVPAPQPAPVPTPEAASTASSTPPPAVAPPAPAVQPASTKGFTVTGQNYSFTPSAITVKKGDKVKVTFVNSGGTHDLKIDEFGVATRRIQAGQQDVVEFTADKVGTFEYYCSTGNHRAMGMKGTLTVE